MAHTVQNVQLLAILSCILGRKTFLQSVLKTWYHGSFTAFSFCNRFFAPKNSFNMPPEAVYMYFLPFLFPERCSCLLQGNKFLSRYRINFPRFCSLGMSPELISISIQTASPGDNSPLCDMWQAVIIILSSRFNLVPSILFISPIYIYFLQGRASASLRAESHPSFKSKES